jgi:mycofactocin radical SAM maturase
MPVEVMPDGVPLRQRFTRGLDAPICLTWELTYACNLACVHCLSSSGRRDPQELTPAEARAIVDELADMKVFYVNIGGGEPMLRPDFFDLLEYSVERRVGVKFSTNGTRMTAAKARRLAGMDYVDVQISIDGALDSTNDAVRGAGSFAAARTAMDHLAAADFGQFKISVVVTRDNVTQLDAFADIARSYGAQLRLTRFRPSGRGVDSWEALHPTAAQQRMLYHWLLERPDVLTGDSFFHLSALGEPLDGLNLCGAGRVVCLIDPVGDVYACPFVIDDEFLAGNVRQAGGFAGVWRQSDLFRSLREPQSAGACASCGLLRFLRRLPGRVHGGQVLHRPPAGRARSRVRVRPRRDGLGRARRHRPSRCPARSLQGGSTRHAHPRAHPGAIPDVGPRLARSRRWR